MDRTKACELFLHLFCGNHDAYLNMPDPSEGGMFTVHQPPEMAQLYSHFEGRQRIGFFPFVKDNLVLWGVIDIDTGNRDDVEGVIEVLQRIQVPYVLERSKSKGWHIWIFLDLCPAPKIRRLLSWVLQESGVSTEVFPKQDTPKETGNGVWCPLFGFWSDRTNAACQFVDLDGKLIDPAEILKSIKPVNESTLDDWFDQYDIPEQSSVSQATISAGPIDNKILEGERNTVLTSLAGTMRAPGMDREEVVQALLAVNERRCIPPLPESEVNGIAESVSNYEPQEYDETTKGSQAEKLVQLAMESCELFCDPTDIPYARVRIQGHHEIYPCDGKVIYRWLCRLMYQTEGKVPRAETIKSTLNILEAKARYEGVSHSLHNRVAYHDDAFWLDLSNSTCQAVRISGEGWKIIDDPPIIFLRYSHQAPQVYPVPGGDVMRLLDFIPVVDEGAKLLLLVFTIACLVPDIPHPIPNFHGPQGAGKSTSFRILRYVIDPSALGILSFPRAADLVQTLSHHWCAFFDNVTDLPDWQSDTLCRAITGEGFTKRMHYTNDDDFIYVFKRVVGLNGINIPASRPDLIDRSILIPLDRIPPEMRKTEKELWEDFEKARPHILGECWIRYPELSNCCPM